MHWTSLHSRCKVTPSKAGATCASQWKMWLIKVISAICLTTVCAAQDDGEDVTIVDRTEPAPTPVPPIFVPPVPSLELQSGWLEVFPSEKVEFRCSVTGSSDWTFTWSRDGKDVQNTDPNASLNTDGSVLTVTAADQTYSGSYTCKGRHKTRGVSTADSKALSLTVHEPPVPSLQLQSTWLEVFPSEKVEFRCSVTGSSDWTFTWSRDGKDVQNTDPNASLNTDGSVLTVTAADQTYSGSYTCKGRHKTRGVSTADSNALSLTVHEPPVPSLQLQSTWLDVFPSEKVEFRCSVTGSSDWTFTWSRDGKDVQNTDPNASLASDGSALTVTAADQTYSGSYTCKGRHKTRGVSTADSNALSLTVHEPPVPSLQLQSTWLDVFPSEKVEFRCSVTGSSDWTFTWSRDGKDVQNTDPNASLASDGSALTVTAADQTYSGRYACKGRHKTRSVSTADSNPLSLSVYANKPKATVSCNPKFDKMFPTERVNFTCAVGVSTGWEYLWYHDGKEVQTANRETYNIDSIDHLDNGQYRCKAKRGKDPFYTEESETASLQVSDPPKPSLRLATSWADVFENETVGFRCEIGNSDWTFTWHKNQQQPLSEDEILVIDQFEGSFNITSVTKSHQGGYACKADHQSRRVSTGFSNTVDVTVYDNVPTPSLSKNPGLNPMYVGETVNFTCKVDVSSGWEYHWYKDGRTLTKTGKTISIHLSTSDRVKYSCRATRGDTTLTHKSQEVQQDVIEIPVPSLKAVTPWLDVFPDESVKLSCEMSGSPSWIYTWYKDGQKVQANDVVSFDPNGATLSINPASATYAGQYKCSGHLNGRSVHSSASSELTLTVYDRKPTVTLIQSPEYNVMHTGDSVSFNCHINVSSGWEYLWYKDDSPITESGNNHTITSVLTHHSGKYKCQTKRKGNTDFLSDQCQSINLDIQERPQAHIVLLTGWSEVFSTDSLVLKCGVQNSEDKWNYTWFKADQEIEMVLSEKHTVTPQNNPDQSLYQCKGIRNGRPSYSKTSDHFKTKNLLLKRRVLLSISGCIVFGIAAVFIGCIVLRVCRKTAKDEYKPEEADLFLSMSQLKDRDDAPCPLVQYITDAALNSSPKEEEENGTICSETTPLPITSQEDQAAATESGDAKEENGGLVSFKQ